MLRTALGIADKGGIDAVTMRAVSQKVRAEPMSLYRHVRDKDDLLDGLVDLVYAEIELPPRGAGWKEALRHHAVSTRAALARHPWAIALMESRTQPGPANLRHHEAVLGVLRAAGFTSLTATRAYNVIDSFVYGFALQQATLPFATAEELSKVAEAMLPDIPASLYPHLRQAAIDLAAARFVYADEFEKGLDLILAGLEQLASGMARGGNGPVANGRG